MTHSGSRFPAPAAVLAACVVFLAGGCGGGGSTMSASGGSSPPPQATNAVSVVIDAGPTDPLAPGAGAIGTVNTPFVSVTLCAHGTANCQTIDHIEVDTQSTGLRVVSSVLSSSLASALTAVMDTQNRPLAECLPFADGYSWGSVRQVDAKIGGEQATGISIEVIGDPAYSSVPGSCSTQAKTQEDTVTTFGANGILGIGTFKQDCGTRCVTDPSPNLYYACPTASNCTSTTVALANQVWNPVALFATDNNGSIVDLPSVGAAGAVSVSGTLIFGIDTESNNALGTATVLTVDLNTGNLSATLNNQTLSNSFVDSGSNGNFFTDSSITQCQSETGFYCPASTQSLSATLTSSHGVTTNVSFSVADAHALFNDNPTFSVFNDLGGTNDLPQSFDFGLPFFLGRKVYNAIEVMSTSAGTGPFLAY
jgi:hypothetical protein